MRQSGQRIAVQAVWLVWIIAAGATGCAQRPAEPSKNTPATQAEAVKEHATGSAAQAVAGKPDEAAAQASSAAVSAAPLGSPSATTSIPGNQLPPPDPKFGGVINLKATDSKPWWPPRIVPPKGAPNVLLIMTDDCGFGSPSTFGGVIPTPALDRIANHGLRYTQFHSTALCSPSRAALITGRNHHVDGFGVVAEGATGYPGYDSVIRRECGTIGQILKQNGYATSWFGKDHNTPVLPGLGGRAVRSMAGRDGLRVLLRLRRRRHQPVDAESVSQHDGHLSLRRQPRVESDHCHGGRGDCLYEGARRSRADKPFFLYYVPGGVHAPHHPTKEWIEKISDMHLFDEGWNKLRETIFANQKRLGIIPQDAKLTAWPKELPRVGHAEL